MRCAAMKKTTTKRWEKKIIFNKANENNLEKSISPLCWIKDFIAFLLFFYYCYHFYLNGFSFRFLQNSDQISALRTLHVLFTFGVYRRFLSHLFIVFLFLSVCYFHCRKGIMFPVCIGRYFFVSHFHSQSVQIIQNLDARL